MEHENHILPFLWLHGEAESVLREYMRAIHGCGCGAVCVESRPHPDFCGEKWWKDMDVILDEARRRKMKVWILDDSHFPTGYANGAVKGAPLEQRRQSVYCYRKKLCGNVKHFQMDIRKLSGKIPTTLVSKGMGKKYNTETFADDRVLGVTCMMVGKPEPVEIPWKIEGKKLRAKIPRGAKKVQVLFLTRNAGIHRSYINMMAWQSCRILIDAVYEKHWEHYKEDFGETIAGFFSDEPELGNGQYFCFETKMGEDYDFPWSRELEAKLPGVLGQDWKRMLPLLWENGGDADLAAVVRYAYMDQVTSLVEECFSRQIGQWCEEHGVAYIGHLIEDGNAHGRTGVSLGHYFRGLSGQHMAGIDDIGGQVVPFSEDQKATGIQWMMGGRDGEFYHYMLPALGASCAAIDPGKNGNCMCEIFGNYGWGEGPRLEKYLADHFLSYGINYYVPHAFSAGEYPDKDCPPHFYAHGHNPGYRHFGTVVRYMNRVCTLLSEGVSVTHVAVLYHAESEWSGKAMLDQKVARILSENQIPFHILPSDVFARKEQYRVRYEKGLRVNRNCYHTLIIPEAEYVRQEILDELPQLKGCGCEVIFVNALPKGSCQKGTLQYGQGNQRVVSLERLKSCPGDYVDVECRLFPSLWRMRYYHYMGNQNVYFFVNEDEKPYRGTVSLKREMECCLYDPWENQYYPALYETGEGFTKVELSLRSGESCMIVEGAAEKPMQRTAWGGEQIQTDCEWELSVCRSVEYPRFSKKRKISSFQPYNQTDKGFSGFIAYETSLGFDGMNGKGILLEITEAGEDVEVFVNGKSTGIQVISPFYYNLTPFLKSEGENKIRIEVATTLERERGNQNRGARTGIYGEVNFYAINDACHPGDHV